MAIENLKRHKSPGIDQIPAELIQTEGRTIRCEIHKLINSFLNKKGLPEEWIESIIVPVYKKGVKQTVVITQAYQFCQLLRKFYSASCCQV